MKIFVCITLLAALCILAQGSPARQSARRGVKRDIGLKLREEARLKAQKQQRQQARQQPEDHTETGSASEDQTVIYGNNVPGNEAEVTHYEFKQDDNGNYNFAYQQSDLQQREETGTVVEDPENSGNYTLDTVVGSYEYIRPDGKKQRVEYTADKDGFKPNVIVTDA